MMRRLYAIGLACGVSAFAQSTQLKLSLEDAISLALQNNLDIALERTTPQIAEQDLKRAQAGATLRGIPEAFREGPRATGGSTGQVQGLSSLTATTPVSGASQEESQSITGTTPLTTGVLPPSFDPSVTGELSWKHTTQPQVVSFLAGVPAVYSDTTIGNGGLNWGFITGATLTSLFNNSHVSSNNLRNDIDPYTTSNLGATLTQPLLRGGGRNLNTRFIRIARNNGKAADFLFQQQVISTVTNVIQLYWDYAALRDDRNNRQKTLDAANQLLNDQKEQLRSGIVAPVDVARAQAEVARSRRDLAASKTLAEQQANVLKEYLSGARADASKYDAVELIPADQIPDVADPVRPLQDLIEQAVRIRPDYQQMKLQVLNSQITLEGSRNALKPQVDLFVTAQSNALTGTPSTLPLSVGTSTFILPRSPNGAFIGNYGDSLAQLLRRNYPDYGGGIRFTIPLRNRLAESDYARDQIEVKRQNIRVDQMEKEIRVDIKNAIASLSQAREALDSAVEERKAQEMVLTAEQERLKVGVTNPTTVIGFQRDLAQSQAAEVTARASLLKAKASLDRAVGETLQNYHISIDESHNAHLLGGNSK